MLQAEAFDIQGAILLQLVLSAYYIFFIIRPLSEIEKNSGRMNYGYRLFITRIIFLIGIDILNPTLASFLDISLLLTLAFITVPKIKKELNYVHSIDTKLAKYDELSDADLTEHGLKNRKILETELFKILKNIQTARSKYDYDTLKYLCTKKMYNIYTSELEVLHEAKLGYNFYDYKLLESQIYSLTSDEKKINIKAAMKISCISYRLDAEGNLVDGSKKDRTIIIHELEFEKNIEQSEKEKNCPNCGAPIKRNVKGTCSYCNTIVDTTSNEWVLAKNKVIAEKLYKVE